MWLKRFAVVVNSNLAQKIVIIYKYHYKILIIMSCESFDLDMNLTDIEWNSILNRTHSSSPCATYPHSI